MNVWPIGYKPLGINFARLRPFGSWESETFIQRSVPWAPYAERPAIRREAAFGFPPKRDARKALPYDPPEPVAAQTGIAWNEKRRLARSVAKAWAEIRKALLPIRMPYRHLESRSRATSLAYRRQPPLARRAALAHRHPAKRDSARAILWGRSAREYASWAALWREPPSKLRFHHLPWGANRPPPPGVRPVPIDPPAPPPDPEPVYQPPAGNAVRLDLYCLLFDGPGNEVPIRIARVPCPGLNKRIFVVDNSIYVKRVSDDAVIHAESLSMTVDYESWAWSLIASLSGDEALALVSDSEPVEIEVGINGLIWRFYVEHWSRNDEFNNKSVSIQGRSLSAELDSPYTLPASRLETDTMTARQIIEQELGTSGWTAVPHSTFVDWTVPGNVFDYNNLTPISAITLVASSPGARVLCRRATRELLLIPRYPYSPWQWPSSPIDATITESQVVQDSGGWDPMPLNRGVYIAGEREGVLVEVYRAGSDGSPWLQSITDKLITEVAAGRERGRNELSATGKRRLVTRSLPVMTGDGDPGLLEPGHLVEVVDSDETWRGLVSATNVNAQWTNQGLTIWQRIDLERYEDA